MSHQPQQQRPSMRRKADDEASTVFPAKRHINIQTSTTRKLSLYDRLLCCFDIESTLRVRETAQLASKY